VRDWIEDFDTPVKYIMQVGATCTLVDGRNAVIWLDSSQVESGAVTLQLAQRIADTFCGPTSTYPFEGTYARETAVFGNAYGPGSQPNGNLIQDGPNAQQDINIVMPDAPMSGSAWSGYFNAQDLSLKSDNANSNESLSIFVKGYFATLGTLGKEVDRIVVHELKHMINFYQRTMVRGTAHATFLEETSAELAEDIFDEPLELQPPTGDRIGDYQLNGAASAYLAWMTYDPCGFGLIYGVGGTAGGYLHRRYGLDLDRELISDCNDNGDPIVSYQCLDNISHRHGGNGFEDDFARIGASVFGFMPMSGTPNGFGFPAHDTEQYSLAPLDPSFLRILEIPPARALSSGFLAAMHTYQIDTIGSGATTYNRTGVRVPAGTTLVVVILKPAPPPPPGTPGTI
jgi:hypothetical protein